MKILFIATEFPPLMVGGVFRSIYFTKYLPSFGIIPIVLTDDVEYSIKFGLRKNEELDSTLLNKFDERVQIKKIKHKWEKIKDWNKLRKKLFHYFKIAETSYSLWEENIWPSINELIGSDVSVIFATVPPFYSALVAVHLAKKIKKPLILDFRDPWLNWRTQPYATYFHYLRTKRAEKYCINNAAHIIVTSDQTKIDYLRFYPELEQTKISVITNGYDTPVSDWKIIRQYSDKFRIGYVGSFYYNPDARKLMMTPWWEKKYHRKLQYIHEQQDWLYRSPFFFFKAIRKMLDAFPEIEDYLEIQFAGIKPAWLDSMVMESNIGNVFLHLGTLSHKESFDFQHSCSALLLTSSKVIGGQDYSIAGKTFEYFGMQKPILGFVTEGAQKRILEKSGMAVICDPDDPEASSKKLLELIDGNITFSPNADFLNSLSRKNLTRELSNIIMETIKSDG